MAAISAFPMPHSVETDGATTDTYGKFTAAPFQSGFGHTIGNSLRRVLLSSLEGAAISAVRIDGAAHEFASLPNVIEDVTEIILNLKKVRLIVDGDMPKTLEISKGKAGPVTAADIATGGTVEVLNPDQLICTLDKDTDFRAELELSVGRGYVPAEANKRPDHPLGTIPVDCLFSPVTRVRYHVGAARVGEKTEMDSLELEIWTDGRITPTLALEKSAKIFHDHLRPFLGSQVGFENAADALIDEEDQRMFRILSQEVEDLNLSVRAQNCLDNAGIVILGELCMKTESRMLKYRNFGKKSLDEIKDRLDDQGLGLGMSFSEELTIAIQEEADKLKGRKEETE